MNRPPNINRSFRGIHRFKNNRWMKFEKVKKGIGKEEILTVPSNIKLEKMVRGIVKMKVKTKRSVISLNILYQDVWCNASSRYTLSPYNGPTSAFIYCRAMDQSITHPSPWPPKSHELLTTHYFNELLPKGPSDSRIIPSMRMPRTCLASQRLTKTSTIVDGKGWTP